MTETQTIETPWTDEQILQRLTDYNGEYQPLLAAQAVVVTYQTDGTMLTADEALRAANHAYLVKYLEDKQANTHGKEPDA
jgi:hypothetical protein